MKKNQVRLAAVLCALLAVTMSTLARAQEKAAADEPELVSKETLHETATKLVYSDGTIKLDIKGRGELVTFLPTPEPANAEPKASAEDRKRGYLVFVPTGREGVLPGYRPTPEEMAGKINLFACPGESENATFAIRPLQDLGNVSFKIGPFVDANGQELPVRCQFYILYPTVEQTEHGTKECHWACKWLLPDSSSTAAAGNNVQAVVDIQVDDGATAGLYTAPITIRPERGEAFEIRVSLEVLPLRLVHGIPWGFFMYHEHWLGIDQPEYRDRVLWRLKEMQQFGISGGTISINTVATPDVSEDGTVDFSKYDLAVGLYREAGFREPPVIAMEKLMRSIADAKGKAAEMKFEEFSEWLHENFGGWDPGVKPEEVPKDVREFARRVVRRIYDHSLEANWPPFYIYFADEPQPKKRRMWMARFMYGIAREVAPKMQTAGTVYTLDGWQLLDGQLDLNIAHYTHPCGNASSNRRYREFADRNHAKLYGIDFIGGFDGFWQGRGMTLVCEKGQLDGIRNWVQWFGEEPQSDFDIHPYKFLVRRWKGGPYALRLKDGRVVRSMVWLGVREGIDDSRYLRTVRALIEKANRSRNPEHRAAADVATRQVEKIMDRVAWVGEIRKDSAVWTSAKADQVRRDLAQVALQLQGVSLVKPFQQTNEGK